jgi:polyisoprenoid-binding protein YceI
MTTLKNEDLPEAYRGRLEGHLKSDDFFSVDKFSEAILEIIGSNKLSSGSFDVNGNLTIKGITEPISFSMSPSDDHWIANLTFDRSKYNVRFRSGTFFENLGDKLIYDDIVIETKLRF